MCLENINKKEEDALEALLMGSLKASEFRSDIAENDIEKLSNEGLDLTENEIKDIESLGTDFFSISKLKKAWEAQKK